MNGLTHQVRLTKKTSLSRLRGYCLPDPNVLPSWGLVTNYGEGGLQNGRGGAREVLPLRKGGADFFLAMLKGGHKKFRGSFYAVA